MADEPDPYWQDSGVHSQSIGDLSTVGIQAMATKHHSHDGDAGAGAGSAGSVWGSRGNGPSQSDSAPGSLRSHRPSSLSSLPLARKSAGGEAAGTGTGPGPSTTTGLARALSFTNLADLELDQLQGVANRAKQLDQMYVSFVGSARSSNAPVPVPVVSHGYAHDYMLDGHAHSDFSAIRAERVHVASRPRGRGHGPANLMSTRQQQQQQQQHTSLFRDRGYEGPQGREPPVLRKAPGKRPQCLQCRSFRVGGGYITKGYGTACRMCGNHIDIDLDEGNTANAFGDFGGEVVADLDADDDTPLDPAVFCAATALYVSSPRHAASRCGRAQHAPPARS